jgi:hypothetical protein
MKIIALFLTLATTAHAQGFDPAYPISIADGVITVLQNAFQLLLALAVLFFVWGATVFIAKAGDEKARAEGKHRMVWGVVAIFIILSTWGFVALLQSILGFSSDEPANYTPQATF